MSNRELRIRVLLEGADKLTRPMRDAAAGSAQLSRAIKTTRDRLEGLKQTQASLAEFRNLKGGLSDTAQKMEQAKAKATALGRALATTEKPTRAMRTEFNRAKKEAEQLSTTHQRQQTQLQTLRGRLDAAGTSTRDMASHERRLRTETAQANEELQEQQRRLREVTERQARYSAARDRFTKMQGTATGMAAGGASAVATGMMMARPLQAATDDAMEFESVMTDINQKVNQSRDAGRLMGLELRRAALAVNQLPEDLQRGTDILTGFGLGARDAMGMMAPIGQAATAYKAEIADLSAATFAANDNLKVPIEQTARALDIMAQAGKSGAFEVKDMAAHFPELTANLKSLGSEGIPAVADLAASLQIVRKGAGDSSSAANNLTNLLSKINAKETVANFKKFGVDVPASIKKAAKEGRSPIEEIVRLTNQVTGGDQAKLSSVFSDMQVQQALRPLMSNLQEYQAIRADALGAKDVVSTDFADRMQDAAEKTKQLAIRAKDARITLGNQLLPVITSVSEKAAVWATKMADLAARHPRLTRALAVAAAVIAALFVVMGGLGIVMAGLVLPFAALSSAAAMFGIGLLPLIGTAAAVVVGIGLLAAAGYWLYENWEKLPAIAGAAWAEIKGYFSRGIGGIAALLLDFNPLGLMWRGMALLLNYFGVNVPARMSDAGAAIVQGIIAGITRKYDALKAKISGMADDLQNWFKGKLGIHSPSRVFAGLGGFVMAGLDQGLAAGANGPVSRIKELSGKLTRALAVSAMGAGGASLAFAAPSIPPQTQPPAISSRVSPQAAHRTTRAPDFSLSVSPSDQIARVLVPNDVRPPAPDFARPFSLTTGLSDQLTRLLVPNDSRQRAPDFSRSISPIAGLPDQLARLLAPNEILAPAPVLDADLSSPLTRINDLSGQMARALAAGASIGPVAYESPSPATAQPAPAAPARPAPSPISVTLHFHGAAGNPQDIAEEVRKAIEQIERDRRGRSFGDE